MKLFLSHVSEDEPLARFLKHCIETEFGVQVLMFPDDAAAGQPWLDQIRDLVERCDGLMSLATADSVKKPYAGVITNVVNVVFGDGQDPPILQRWWTLQLSGRPNQWASVAGNESLQDAIWGTQHPVDLVPADNVTPTRAQRTREWSELSMWFPAISAPVAAVVSPALEFQHRPTGAAFQRLQFGATDVRGRNVSFGALGGSGGLVSAGTLSHSYLYIFKLAEVWRGYRALSALFAQ